MKRALVLVTLAVLAAAYQPVAAAAVTGTQTLTVHVRSATIDDYDAYQTGQGHVRIPGFRRCHTPPDLGWLSVTDIECQVQVPTGTRLTLTAIADDATSTVGIAGDCRTLTATTCVVKMNGPRSISAVFSPVAIWVMTNSWPEAHGAYATETDTYNTGPLVIDFFDADFRGGSRRIAPGTVVTITGTANPGYVIQWGAPCTDIVVNDTCTLTIDTGVTNLELLAVGPQPL